MVSIPVPSQDQLRKQWCLFDQTENIDFNTEVRKITGDFTDNFQQLEGSASELEVYKDLDIRENVEPIAYDFSYLHDGSFKKRRHANTNRKKPKPQKKETRGSQTKKITRVSKNVSVRRH